MQQDKEIIEKKIKEGGVYATLFFDMTGKEKEKLSNMLVEFVGRLSQERGVLFAVGEIDEPIQYGGELITSAEVKVLADSFSSLLNICMQYSPFGVEIEKPDEISLSLGEAQNLLLYVSQTAANFSRYVYEKVLTEEERGKIVGKFAAREELGRRLKEKKESEAK